MTSIVITPFDSEHTEELKEFIWSVIEGADFAECMPPSVRLVDVQALEAERDALRAALNLIETDKDGDGFICREAMEQVRQAMQLTKGTE